MLDKLIKILQEKYPKLIIKLHGAHEWNYLKITSCRDENKRAMGIIRIRESVITHQYLLPNGVTYHTKVIHISPTDPDFFQTIDDIIISRI